MTCWLVCAALGSGLGCTREVRVPVSVPVAPVPCRLPGLHVQAACGDVVDCLLTEFALTLQAEHSLVVALAACPSVTIVES